MWAMSKRDRRFSDAVDPKTVQLFVVWFFICIGMTVAGYPIANIAHGLGCVTGLLLGWTITSATATRIAGAVYIVVLIAGVLVADTVARPWVNVSKYVGGDFAKEAGGDEARLGYAAIETHDDKSAIRWYSDAVRMDPTDASSWFNLGIAYQRTSQKQSAIAAYQKACDLNPGDSKYRSALDAMR
jgi:tetratricopeptide (TPR) repeat protein